MKKLLTNISPQADNLKTRQDKTRQDKTRQDKTRQDKTRRVCLFKYNVYSSFWLSSKIGGNNLSLGVSYG